MPETYYPNNILLNSISELLLSEAFILFVIESVNYNVFLTSLKTKT